MYDIAEQVQRWLDDGRHPTVATVVSTRGFSSRELAATAAWVDGEPAVGRLIDEVRVEDVLDLDAHGLVQVTVSEADAVAAGLACGGTATVLVQHASAYPGEVWRLLVNREPVCLVTRVRDDELAGTDLFTPGTIRDAHGYGDQVPRLFARGTKAAELIDGEPTVVAVGLWPVPTLVVVGDGLIADALRDTATLLGWQPQVTAGVDESVAAIAVLHRGDAVVVLSHDRAVDGPALVAALHSASGYVGALGSRRTQAARRDWLTDHDVAADAQAHIHGPAGLDIDAHTPVEIAISIVAEILGARAGSSGGPLSERSGPVHVDGVQAPPPRY